MFAREIVCLTCKKAGICRVRSLFIDRNHATADTADAVEDNAVVGFLHLFVLTMFSVASWQPIFSLILPIVDLTLY